MRRFELLTIISVSFVLASCGDVVESRYGDMTEARSDKLFERGWLPDILPPSTMQIVTKNDLDSNQSSGEFRMRLDDFPGFRSQLRECTKDHIDLDELVANAKEGYRLFCYKDADSTWLFYINAATGYCKYQMQPTK